MITHFKVEVPSEQIDDLKARLARTLWPDAVENTGWSYGTSLEFMKRLRDHWHDRFDWRVWESRLNAYPQFMARVDGIDIHFIHVTTGGAKRVPLLLTHGWPSSVLEYLDIIPLLSPHFDLVIPSLPGHGYSEASSQPGLSIYRAAELWHRLMTNVLGYDRYAAQGGDWGAYLTSRLAFLYPGSLIGIHLSYVVGGLMPYLGPGSSPLSRKERDLLEERSCWEEAEGGYEHLQCTKPLSLAYGLTDSPVGLAAWVTEKWQSWTDCGGNLETRFSLDELLANISWYWFTRTIGTSARLYYETSKAPWTLGKQDRISVPTAIASFPRELAVSPREWAERIYNVEQWTDMPRGGHFAAAEEPALLAEDIIRFFTRR